jgi:hypothetical protein
MNDSIYAVFTEVKNDSKLPNIDEPTIYPNLQQFKPRFKL